jgi:hypothetical protein
MYTLFQVLGDPSLRMWVAPPGPQLSIDYEVVEVLTDGIRLKYPVNDAIITAFQQTEDATTIPLGRAKVMEGMADVTFVNELRGDLPIQLVATKPGALSRLLTPPPVPEPVDLTNEDAFGDDAVRIDFDDEQRFIGESISDQYLSSRGVRFVDDAFTTPTIRTSGETTTSPTPYSQPFFLLNEPDSEEFGPAAPLAIEFVEPVTRAGMYLGNGWSCLQDAPQDGAAATLTAYNASSDVIFSVTRDAICAPVNVFIGIDAGAAVIRSLKLQYSRHEFAEAIDDLMYE